MMSDQEKPEDSPNLSVDYKLPAVLTSTQNPESIAPLLSPGLVSSTDSSFRHDHSGERNSREPRKLSVVQEQGFEQTEYGHVETPHDLRPFTGRDGSPVQRFIEIADTVDTLKSAHDLSVSMGPLPIDSFHVPMLGTPSLTVTSCPNLSASSKRRKLDFAEDPLEVGLDLKRRFEQIVDENLKLKQRISYLAKRSERADSYRDSMGEEYEQRLGKMQSDMQNVQEENKRLHLNVDNLTMEIETLKGHIEETKTCHKAEINECDKRYQLALQEKDRFYEKKLQSLNAEWEARLENELQEIRKKDALQFEQLRMRWESDQQCELQQLQSLHEEELQKLFDQFEKEKLDQVGEQEKLQIALQEEKTIRSKLENELVQVKVLLAQAEATKNEEVKRTEDALSEEKKLVFTLKEKFENALVGKEELQKEKFCWMEEREKLQTALESEKGIITSLREELSRVQHAEEELKRKTSDNAQLQENFDKLIKEFKVEKKNSQDLTHQLKLASEKNDNIEAELCKLVKEIEAEKEKSAELESLLCQSKLEIEEHISHLVEHHEKEKTDFQACKDELEKVVEEQKVYVSQLTSELENVKQQLEEKGNSEKQKENEIKTHLNKVLEELNQTKSRLYELSSENEAYKNEIEQFIEEQHQLITKFITSNTSQVSVKLFLLSALKLSSAFGMKSKFDELCVQVDNEMVESIPAQTEMLDQLNRLEAKYEQLEEELVGEREKHEAEMGALHIEKLNLEDKIKKILAEVDITKAELQRAKDSEESLNEQLKIIKKDYMKILEQEEFLSCENQKLLETLTHATNQYEKEIGELRNEVEQIALRSIYGNNDTERSKLLKQLSDSAVVIAEYEEKLRQVQTDFNKRTLEMETQHLEAIKTLRFDFEKKLSQVEAVAKQLEVERQALQINAEVEKRRVEKEVTEKFSEEIATLAAKHTLEKVTLEIQINRLKEELVAAAREVKSTEFVTNKSICQEEVQVSSTHECEPCERLAELAEKLKQKEIELDEVKLNHENTLRAIHESHRVEFAKLAAHNVGTTEVQRKVEELEEHVRELTKQLDQSQTWQISQKNFLKRQLADALEDREAGVGVASPEPLEKIKGVCNHHARLEALYQDLRRQLSQVSGPVPASVCKTTDLLHTALEAAFHEVEEEASSLTQQLEVADKQVKSLRQFLADQAEDREAEREEHQLKIARLEAQLVEKDKEKTESLKLVQEIEALERQLEQRNEMCRGATDSTLRMERALKAANEKIADLNGVILAAEQRLALKQRAEYELREEVQILKNTLVEQGRVQQELNDQIEFLRLSNGDRPRPDGAASNFGSDRSDSPQVRAYVSEPPHLFQELKDLIQVLMERVDRKTRELEALQISATDSDTSRAVSPLTEDISVKDRVDKRFASSLEDLRSPTPLDFLQLKPLEDLNRLNLKLEQLSKIEEVALKRIRDMEMQLKTARESEKVLSEEIQGLKNEVKNKDAELKELAVNYDRMNCYNLELKSERDELQTEFSAKEKLVASLEMRIASMEPAVSSLGSFEELKMKLQDAHQRQEELEYSLEKKESQVRDLTRQLEEFRQSLVSTETELIKLRKEKSTQEAEQPFSSTPISAISRPSPEHSKLDLKLAQKDAEIEVLKHEVSELKEELEAQRKVDKSVSVEELRDAPRRESLIEFSRRENLEHTTVNEKSQQDASLNLEAPRSKSIELESVPRPYEDLRETVKELQWKYERKLEQCEYSEKECDLLRETVHDLQSEVRELLKKIGDQDRLTSALQASKKTLLEELAKLKSTLGSQAGLEEETEKKVKTLQADCDNLVLARDSLMTEVDDLRSLLSRYQEQSIDFKSDRDDAFKKIDELSLTVDELQKELKEQTDANDELHRQLCEAQDMAAELQCSLQEANRKIETELERVTNELSSVKSDNEKLERALGNMKEASCKLQTEKNELMIECSKLNTELVDMESELSKLKSDYSNRITDLSELNLKYKKLCDLYDSIVAELRQKQDELSKAQDEKTFLGLKVDDLTDDLKVFREKNAFLTEDISNLKVTISELNDENAELKAHLRTLRNQLENDVMKVSVDDLFDKVEDELNQTARYDKSVLAYVDTLNSPNMLPTPEWSCDEGIQGHSTLVPDNGNHSPSISSIDGVSLEERDLAKKVHKEGMKVLALSEDLFARQQVRSMTCPSCGREEAETPVVLVEKTVVRPESPTRWRSKAISLEREVERLKTELNIEKMISENQRKSNESTQHHLLSIVSTMNKERSNAVSSQEEIVTLKDQIKSLRLQLISSNEEVKSMRCLLSDENDASKSRVSSSSCVNSESDSARKLNRKLSSQVAKLKEDKEKLISAIRSLNAKIVEMQRVGLRFEGQTDGETDKIIAAVATQPGEIKHLVHHYLTRALKAESSRRALVYQKRYLEKVVEAQRAEVTIRNISEYSDTKRRSFRVVSLMIISCIRMKLIVRMRATRLKKLKNSLNLDASK